MDHSMFIFSNGNEMAYFIFYVDDIMLTAFSISLLQRIISHLSFEFDMNDLGILHHFIVTSVTHDDKGIFLHQRNYIADILHRANMLDCNMCLTPVDTKSIFAADHSPHVSDPTLYCRLAGALQYLTF